MARLRTGEGGGRVIKYDKVSCSSDRKNQQTEMRFLVFNHPLSIKCHLVHSVEKALDDEDIYIVLDVDSQREELPVFSYVSSLMKDFFGGVLYKDGPRN